MDRSMLKMMGDNGEPCGTPCVGVIVVSDVTLLCLMYSCLFVRKDLMSVVKCLFVCCSMVCRMPEWYALSKACWRSNEITRVYVFALKLLAIACVTLMMLSVVLLLGKKAV